ncbi:putative phage-related protein tail component [uncultured Mediterranean phage uvMED]|nr:putative phage-related protein tail component [uncultured Mediterranean phage uvMED]
MKVVKVYGALRKRLGQCRFEFEAATPAQALKALCVNFPGLDKWLIDSEKDGVGYRVTIGKERVIDDLSPLVMPWSEREVFSITPIIAGAGRGVGMIGLGLGLVALAVVTGGASIGFTTGGFTAFAAGGTAIPFAAATFGTKLAIAAGTIGIGLTFMGIAQAISPQPDVPQFDESAQLESFTFSNVVNTSKQGLPVPLAYGRVFVGSAVISSGLDVDEVKG